MNRNRSGVLWALTGIGLCVSLATVCSGQVQTVYTSFTSSGGYSTNAWCVSGSTNADCNVATRYVAAPFTPTVTYILSGLTLALVNYSGTNHALINLRSSSGGQPGTILQSWTQSALPKLPQTGTVSVTSNANITLQAGQTYWVEVESASADTLDEWLTNSQGLGGGLTNINNGGWIALGNNYGAQSLPAFSVQGVSLSSGALSISPAALTFTMTVGGQLPPVQSVNFTSSSGTISWTVYANESFVSTGPSSGSVTQGSPETVSVGINPNIIGANGTVTPAGTYSATVTVNYGPSLTQTATLNITLYIVPPVSGTLGVSPSSLTYSAPPGQLPPPQNVTITSTSGTLTWGVTTPLTSTAPANWISASPTGGQASPGSPGTTTVSVNSAALSFPAGTYTANVVVSSGTQVRTVAVTYTVVSNQLLLNPQQMTFAALVNAPAPPGQIFTVTATSGAISFTANVQYPPGTPVSQSNWLLVLPQTATAAANLTVSVQPSGLPPGNYAGYVDVTPNGSTNTQQVSVILVVKGSPDDSSVTFTYQIGGPLPASQTVNLSNANSVTAMAGAGSDQGWLSVSPTTATVDANGADFTLAASPGSLLAGQYQGICSITDIAGDTFVYLVTLIITPASNPNPGTVVTISQVADGGSWSTTIILVNTDSVPAPFTLQFTGDGGSPFAPALVGLGKLSTVSDTIPVGGSRTISTTGTAPSLTEGWARITSAQSVNGTAIFRLQQAAGSPVPYQEAAVPLLAAGSPTLLFPFDNNAGLATGFALAAPDNTGSTSVIRHQRSQSGLDITTALDSRNSSFVDGNCLVLPPHGHCADVLNSDSAQPANLRGVAEFDAQGGGSIFGLGIRANGGAFTSIEAITEQPAATKVISQIADGGLVASGRWKTTVILVNTDAVPAAFTVNFWQDNGTAFPVQLVGGLSISSISGTIPVGGSYTIETADATSQTTTGWAEVLSSQSIGGTAIFREEVSGQEAAVPLLTSAAGKLLLPYTSGSGFALGVALVNPDPNNDAKVSYVLRDQDGNPVPNSSPTPIVLPRHRHTDFVLPVPGNGTAQQTGVVEFDSPNVNIYILGIRSNNGAFTSVRALSK